ncbi:MAG: putative transporter [Paludibacteraceae bacterium]|nr:putative transporter [Bacteroidales bacterium]
MSWLHDLLIENSVAHTLLLYSFIITVGMLLGKIKVKGISLGVTFVLFTGLLFGHLGIAFDSTIVGFLKDFGLILFIFTIGLQVGPGFFSSFKKGGLQLNGWACLVVVLGVGVTIGLYYLFSHRISLPMMVGIMSGAITSTPGLGAAEEALTQLQQTGVINEVPPISLGYAVAYPIAVLGTILVMIIIRALFRVDVKQEETELQMRKETNEKPDILTFRITNPEIDGLTLIEVMKRFGHEAVATRIFDGSKMTTPHTDTVLRLGYLILIVTRDIDAEALTKLLGETTEFDWIDDSKDLVSRRIVVTQDNINGKTIRQLQLRKAYNINITRVNRAGINLLADPDLVLQVGDKVMVVGPLESIEKVEKLLGNTLKHLNEPHIITIFLGIFLGIILGSVPIYFPNLPMPTKLGLSGGPLIIAILIGRFGYKLKLISYTTVSANLMLREVGICLFLASLGLLSGGRFVETVVSPNGLLWMLCGFLITVVPALIVGIIAKAKKMNYFTVCGLIAGAHTNLPPLVYATSLTDSDESAVVYSTVYPLVSFLRIVIAQFLILIFA